MYAVGNSVPELVYGISGVDGGRRHEHREHHHENALVPFIERERDGIERKRRRVPIKPRETAGHELGPAGEVGGETTGNGRSVDDQERDIEFRSISGIFSR